jgi:hypothetical protein
VPYFKEGQRRAKEERVTKRVNLLKVGGLPNCRNTTDARKPQ